LFLRVVVVDGAEKNEINGEHYYVRNYFGEVKYPGTRKPEPVRRLGFWCTGAERIERNDGVPRSAFSPPFQTETNERTFMVRPAIDGRGKIASRANFSRGGTFVV